jgi:ubiquinone/menaquinone biosynthesis C-methylase UbiE
VIKDVSRLYAKYWKYEMTRLTKDPYHRLEYDTTFRFLNKYLPKKGTILDAGGGTGTYTVSLAMRGYDAVLLDLSKENLKAAQAEIIKTDTKGKIKSLAQGTITDLSRFGSDTFDAVLCLGGPISLVYGRDNRRKAMNELVRVAKKGAPCPLLRAIHSTSATILWSR